MSERMGSYTPCFTIREVSVDLTVADVDMLIRGLKAAGYTLYHESPNLIMGRAPNGEQFRIEGGKVVVSGQYITNAEAERVASGIKVAYAEEAVQTAAERYGWSLETEVTASAAEPLTHTLKKGGW